MCPAKVFTLKESCSFKKRIRAGFLDHKTREARFKIRQIKDSIAYNSFTINLRGIMKTSILGIFVLICSMGCSHLQREDKDLLIGIGSCPYKKADGTKGKGLGVGIMTCDKE